MIEKRKQDLVGNKKEAKRSKNLKKLTQKPLWEEEPERRDATPETPEIVLVFLPNRSMKS